MKFYRYDEIKSGGYYMDEWGDMVKFGKPNVSIKLTEYEVIKGTLKGKWICPVDWLNHSDLFKKWISTRSKFAWDTKEKALESFIARKTRQISILQDQLYVAERALKKGKEINV
jgi:hypothetical protein